MARNSYYTVAAMAGGKKAGKVEDYVFPRPRAKQSTAAMMDELKSIEKDLGI